MKFINIKDIVSKDNFKKNRKKFNKFISNNYSKFKEKNYEEFFLNKKEKFKKFSIDSFSKIKDLTNKDFFIKGKKKYYKLTSSYQNFTEKFVNNLVKEEGSEIWSGLSQSQKWSGGLIWTFVGVTSFSIIWSFFTLIDDTIQVQGKLEPQGTTIDVKVPLGGVIKKIMVEEGEVVSDKQILLELDTRAPKSKLKALNIVKSQIMADILLSKIQLGEQINTEDLTNNQKIKLISLKNEYDSRISAAQNAVDQAKFRRNPK